MRGAHRGHLARTLAPKTVAFAGGGSLVGVAVGLLAAMVVLGPGTFFEASAGSLLVSALLAATAGLVVTGLALYVPGGGRSDARWARAAADRAGPTSAWRRLHLDVALLVAAGIGEAVALSSGAFNAPRGSVSQGRAVSLPSHLLAAPVVAWLAGARSSPRGCSWRSPGACACRGRRGSARWCARRSGAACAGARGRSRAGSSR